MQVRVKADKIVELGLNLKRELHDSIIYLKGQTLMPGMIEGHSHILLHPYNETAWTEQVLFESQAERVVRAYNHLQASLKAGFTTLRDLGTEGAEYADIGMKAAIKKKLIIAPDLLCAGRAIVATTSYAPKSLAYKLPQGAEEADGDQLTKVVRDQIGHGVDIIKIYADYRYGNTDAARPTFTIDEIKTVVETASTANIPVVAHASTREGMRRATLGGVQTIEHGDEGDLEIFTLMKNNQVAYCPTLAASESIASYRGWRKGIDSLPANLKQKHNAFRAAILSGVTMLAGGDVGVFTHGDNAKELVLMNEYGMDPINVLRSVTSVNANAFHLQDRGKINIGFKADMIAVNGMPDKDMIALTKVNWVMKSGKIIK